MTSSGMCFRTVCQRGREVDSQRDGPGCEVDQKRCSSSGTREAANEPLESLFPTFLVRETLPLLLLILVKRICPLSLVLFPAASHALAHFHAQTINILLRCWFCFSKAAHSSALLSCRRAAVASQPCCVGQRGCEALSHTQTHTGNVAVFYTQSPATGGEEITWV